MADQPTIVGAQPPGESRSSLHQDPFWQETPRYNRGSLAALMAAIQQIVPPPPLGHSRGPTQAGIPAQARRPQCTHITMVRLHGNNVCQGCGRVPSIGWLYACREDWLLDYQKSANAEVADLTVPNQSDYFDVMARLATSLQMSPSVVSQIRAGAYTFDEVDKIIAQREHVIATLKKTEHPDTDDTPPSLNSTLRSHEPSRDVIASVGSTPTAAMPRPPNVTPPGNTPSAKASMKKSLLLAGDRCNYMCCHACRPYMHDRIHFCLDTVLKSEQPPLTDEEAKTLPVLDAKVLRNVNVKPSGASPYRLGITRSEASVDLTLQQRDGAQDGEIDWTPTTDDSSSIYDDDNDEFNGDAFPCPGPGICPVYSRNSGCAYDVGFDDGQRAINHSFARPTEAGAARDDEHLTPDRARYRLPRIDGSIDMQSTPLGRSSTTSSISLPTPTTIPLTPITPVEESFGDILAGRLGKPGRAATVSGALSPTIGIGKSRLSVGTEMTGKTSKSSLGRELEVEGGVALTEGAVESRLPDIATE